MSYDVDTLRHIIFVMLYVCHVIRFVSCNCYPELYEWLCTDLKQLLQHCCENLKLVCARSMIAHSVPHWVPFYLVITNWTPIEKHWSTNKLPMECYWKNWMPFEGQMISRVPIDCQWNSDWIPIDYQWSEHRVPIDHHWSATLVPIDYQWNTNWLSQFSANEAPLNCHLSPIWMSMECQFTTNRIPTNYQWSANWRWMECQSNANGVPMECHLTTLWVPLNCHLSAIWLPM